MPKDIAVMSSRWKEYVATRQGAAATPTPQASVIADAAVSLGLPCFPCGSDKRPLTAHGFKDASADPSTIRTAFANPAAVMIGVPTGSVTGWAVIDIDCKDGARGQEWLDANSYRLPPTRTHVTRSGGWHLIFKMPSVELRNSASKIAPGVDVRGEGGYVIVPPSPGYHLAPKDMDLADIPDWLLDAAMPKPQAVVRSYVERPTPVLHDGGTHYGLAALTDECDAIRRASDGTKHATLNKAAFAIGGLVTAGELHEGPAFAELSAALDTIRPYCRDWRAAQNTLRRSFQEGMGRPRDVPEMVVTPLEDIHPAAGLIAKLSAKAAKRSSTPMPVTGDIMDVDGVLKMLVDECVRTAIRPQPFLALGAAICAVGALAGRQYRTSTDLRTNIYIAAIAESGGGKDHSPEVIRRCIDAAGLERYLGGETLASGRAVLSALEGHPAKLFQVDELGMFLAGVTGKKAAPHKAEIWSELMKLYSRAKGIYRGTEYANKKDNPRIDIHQPCVSFYGTTTPTTFWGALEAGAMSDGSLARFLVFITDNNRPERNREAGIFEPDEKLLSALRAITRGRGEAPTGGNLPMLYSAPMLATKTAEAYTVPMTDEAQRIHEKGLSREDAWARKVEGTPQAATVNRLGENAAKLALVSAISRCPEDPIIEARDVAWGWAVAEHCTRSFFRESGQHIADTEFEARMNKAINIIRKFGPCTKREMFQKGFKLSERDRNDVLSTLVTNGVITEHATEHTGAGRPTIRYTLASVPSDETEPSVDE